MTGPEMSGAAPATGLSGMQLLMRPSSWTLRSKLVASMLALFAAIMFAIGAVTVFGLSAFLSSQLDDQVRGLSGPPGRSGDRPAAASGSQHDHGGGFGGGPQDRPGPADGSLTVRVFGGVASGVAFDVGRSRPLDQDQLRQISAAHVGAAPTTVAVPSLGTYRLIRVDNQRGGVTISGFSTEQPERTVHHLAVIILAVTAAGLLGVGAGGTWLVRANLRPLRRVAGTATRVAQLPLDSGAVALADRVPEQDTDPRTEVGQVGAALNGLLDHVGAALNARHQSEMRVRQFVADASHELRTPLASIRGYAELSRRERAPVPAAVSHALSRVESEATRMSSLVDDLLLLARLDAGRPLEREPVDLTHLVIDAVSDAHAAAPGHTWRLDVPDEPVLVQGDAARLHQVLANLLANARTHTPEGTTVSAQVRQQGDQVAVDVEDDGPGIPAALQPDVFQCFTRGDSSRSRVAGSTGLGLSIVSAVASAHGGSVALDSRPGRTRFSVSLPAGTPPPSQS